MKKWKKFGTEKKRQARQGKNVKLREDRLERANVVVNWINDESETGASLTLCNVAAFGAVEMWNLIKDASGWEPPLDSLEAEKAIFAFFRRIQIGEVEEHVVAQASLPYTLDKFESRMETRFLALSAMLLKVPENPAFGQVFLPGDVDRSLKVISVGGGPGNCLVGFDIFAPLLGVKALHATSFDFSCSWEDIVVSVNTCMNGPGVEKLEKLKEQVYQAASRAQPTNDFPEHKCNSFFIDFEQCDLKLSTDADVNAKVLKAAAQSDFILFSYVLFESQGHKYPLFPEILRALGPTGIVLILDIHKSVIQHATDIVAGLGIPLKTFEIGSAAGFPFKGLVVFRAPISG